LPVLALRIGGEEEIERFLNRQRFSKQLNARGPKVVLE
jgi:hypothetical protein